MSVSVPAQRPPLQRCCSSSLTAARSSTLCAKGFFESIFTASFFCPSEHRPPSSYPPAPDLPSKPPPPPLPQCPPPPPPPPKDLPTSSSLVSSEGYQKLQSMMKTEGSCYTAVPQACAPPLGYHHYPTGTTSYHTPPLSAYSYLLAPPPPSVMGLAPSLSGGYPPPSTVGHNQLPPPLPPGMPPVGGLSRGTWMR